MMKENHKYALIVGIILLSLMIILIFSYPDYSGKEPPVYNPIYNKQIRIDSVDPAGIVILSSIGSEPIEKDTVLIFNVDGESIGKCPDKPIDPGKIFTCTIDIVKCPSGTKLRVVTPGNEYSAICP